MTSESPPALPPNRFDYAPSLLEDDAEVFFTPLLSVFRVAASTTLAYAAISWAFFILYVSQTSASVVNADNAMSLILSAAGVVVTILLLLAVRRQTIAADNGRRVRRLALFVAIVGLLKIAKLVPWIAALALQPGVGLAKSLDAAFLPFRSYDGLYTRSEPALLLASALLFYSLWKMEVRFLRVAAGFGFMAMVIQLVADYRQFSFSASAFPLNLAPLRIAVTCLSAMIPFAPFALLAWLAWRPDFVRSTESQ